MDSTQRLSSAQRGRASEHMSKNAQINRTPPPFSREGVRKRLEEGSGYDDVLITNEYSNLKDFALERGFITRQEAQQLAAHKADRVAALIAEGKSGQFAGREYRPDLSAGQAYDKRQEIYSQLEAQAPVERQKDIALLGKMGYTPEDVQKFGTDTSGFIPSGVPIIGGNEVPILSKSFWQDPARNLGISAYQGGVGLGATAEGMVAPARALATRFTGGDPTQFYAPNENPLVEAGTIFGSNAAESAAGFPARYAGMRVGGDLGFKAGLALSGGNPLWGGVGAVAGGMLGQLGMGKAMETLNDTAMNLILGRENAARLQQSKQELAERYPLAARVGEELPDLTMFGPSFKVKGWSGKAARQGFKQAGMKGLRQGVVDSTEFAGDLAERGGESALNMVLAYKQSEDEKKLGMPGKSAWDILAEGALGAVMQGETRFGKAIYGGMNRLTDPRMIQQAINRTAPGATPMSPAVDTGSPMRPGMRRFNLGGRIESGVDAEGNPILKGARYAIYDPETRKAQVYTDNEFPLEGTRTRNAARSLEGTNNIFKRQPVIQYDDAVVGAQRQILGITRDAGVLVRDYKADGTSSISAVPLSEIRNAKINKRIKEVIENQGVRPNSRPAPFMPEAFTNFNPVAFPDTVSLSSDSEPIPARVVERIGGKTDASYIVALPDGSHIRAHESQINVDSFKGGEHVSRGAIKETDFPRSLADLAPKHGGLQGLIRIGEGSDAPHVELTPQQRRDYQAIATGYKADIDAIKREPDATRRGQMLDIVNGKIANEYLATNPIPAPAGSYKEGDVIDVNLSQTKFAGKPQTAIVTDVNDYGYAVRLVDHPNVGTFTVQDSHVVGSAVPSVSASAKSKGLESLAAGRISSGSSAATRGEGVPAVTRGYSAKGMTMTDVAGLSDKAKHVDYMELPAHVHDAIQKRFKKAIDAGEVTPGNTVEFVEPTSDGQIHGQIHVHDFDNMTFQIVATSFPEGGGAIKEQNVTTYNVRYNPDTDMWDVYSVAPEMARRVAESEEAAYMAISHLKNVMPTAEVVEHYSQHSGLWRTNLVDTKLSFNTILATDGVSPAMATKIAHTYLEAVNTKWHVPDEYKTVEHFNRLLEGNTRAILKGDYIAHFDVSKFNPKMYYRDVWTNAPLDMSDPAQFARASDAGRQYYEKLQDPNLHQFLESMANDQRLEALKNLVLALQEDSLSGKLGVKLTEIEKQLYFMMASKWIPQYSQDENGNVSMRLTEITNNNEALPVVYAQANYPEFVKSLRNGEVPKKAFYNAIAKSTELAISSRNVPKDGWKKYAGGGTPENIAELMRDVQGTIWCIASSDHHAKSYLDRADFYVYFHNYKPTIAYGGNAITVSEPPRGNRASQAATHQEKLLAIEHMKQNGVAPYYEEDVQAIESARNIVDGVGTEQDIVNVNKRKKVVTKDIPTAGEVFDALQRGYQDVTNDPLEFRPNYNDYSSTKSQLQLLTELPAFRQNYNKLQNATDKPFTLDDVKQIVVRRQDDYYSLVKIYHEYIKGNDTLRSIKVYPSAEFMYNDWDQADILRGQARFRDEFDRRFNRLFDDADAFDVDDFDGDLSWISNPSYNRILLRVKNDSPINEIKLHPESDVTILTRKTGTKVTYDSRQTMTTHAGAIAIAAPINTHTTIDRTNILGLVAVYSTGGSTTVMGGQIDRINGGYGNVSFIKSDLSYATYNQIGDSDDFQIDIEGDPESINKFGTIYTKSNPTPIFYSNRRKHRQLLISAYTGPYSGNGYISIGDYTANAHNVTRTDGISSCDVDLGVEARNIHLPEFVDSARIVVPKDTNLNNVLIKGNYPVTVDVNSSHQMVNIRRRHGKSAATPLTILNLGDRNVFTYEHDGIVVDQDFKVIGYEPDCIFIKYGELHSPYEVSCQRLNNELFVYAEKNNDLVYELELLTKNRDPRVTSVSAQTVLAMRQALIGMTNVQPRYEFDDRGMPQIDIGKKHTTHLDKFDLNDVHVTIGDRELNADERFALLLCHVTPDGTYGAAQTWRLRRSPEMDTYDPYDNKESLLYTNTSAHEKKELRSLDEPDITLGDPEDDADLGNEPMMIDWAGHPEVDDDVAFQEITDADGIPSKPTKKVGAGYRLQGSFRISVPTSQMRRYREERNKIALEHGVNTPEYNRAMNKLNKQYKDLISQASTQVLAIVNKIATEQRPNVTGYQQKETTATRQGYAIKTADRNFNNLPAAKVGDIDNRLGKYKMMFNALGEDYSVDAFRVSNRAQLKTVLQKQYKYDADNAGRVAEVVDRFARAWAFHKIQTTHGFRPTEIKEITGKLAENLLEMGAYNTPSSDMLFQHFPGTTPKETKLVAQYMREFYEERFAAFGVLDEAYDFSKKFRGAIFRTNKSKDDAVFNVIVGFASRDESTGIHEIAHALFRGMGREFQVAIAHAFGINPSVLKSQAMNGRIPLWVEEKWAAAFEGSLRAGIAPQANDVKDPSRPRQQDPTLSQLWLELSQFLTDARNVTIKKKLADGVEPKFDFNSVDTDWVAPFKADYKLYAGNELELTDGSLVLVETTQTAAGEPVAVRDVDTGRVSTVGVDEIRRYAGRVPNGFNTGILDTLSTWLRSYYSNTAKSIEVTLPQMVAGYTEGETDLGQLRAANTNLQKVAFQEAMDEPRSSLLSSLSRLDSVQSGIKSLVKNNRLQLSNKGAVTDAYDRYGKPSNSFRLLQDVYKFDGNTAAAYYAQTETPEFKKWSENLPLVEAVHSIQISPDIDLNSMTPDERNNYRRFEAGTELANLASEIMRDGADDNDVDKFVDLADQYYRGQGKTLKEIRKAVDEIVNANEDDNVLRLMSFETSLRQELATLPDFEQSRKVTAKTDVYRSAAHTPKTGKGFVTVSFPAFDSSNLVRSKGGVVLTSGIASEDGNRQGAEYIKFKNPQVINLEGQGIDRAKLDRIIANATKAKRDSVVILNLRHSNTVNSALHNVAIPITAYGTKSVVAVPGVDLGTYFSGGGTLEASVYDSVFPKIAVEYNAEIASVYRANHGDHVQVKDVQEVDPTSLKDVQWFHASPVCKNFSDANPNAIETILDKKTGKAVVDAIDHSRPPIVTIENVANYRKSESFTAILDALRRNGYEFDYGVYKTSKYGGSTSRERLIVRAVRGFSLPPVIQPNHQYRTWYDSIKDIIHTLPISELAPNQLRKLEASKIDVRAMKTPVLFTQNSYHAVGITADKVFPSFTTSGGTYRILMPGGQVRAITGIAFRRMMGLPDAYLLPESEPLARKILANGVPAELSQTVMAPLADAYARHQMTNMVVAEMNRPDVGEEAAYQEVDDEPRKRTHSTKSTISYVANTANIPESEVQKLIDNGSLPKPINGEYDPITFRALQARVSVAVRTGKDGKLNWDNAVKFVPIIRDLNKKQIPFDTDGALEFSELVHWLKTRKGELFPMPNIRGEKITVERMIRTFINSNVAPSEYVVGGDRSGLMYDPRILSALETYTNMRHNGYAVEFIKGVLNPEGEQRTLEGGVGVKEFLEILNSGRDKPITQDIITNWRVKGGYIPAMLNDPAHGIGKLFTPDHLLIAEKIADLIDSGVSQSVTKGQLKARLIADPEYVEAFTRIVTHPWYQSTSTTTMASIKEAKPIMRMADVIAAIAKEVEPNKFTVANYQALERSGNIPRGLKPSDGTTRRQYNDDYVKLAVMALNPKYRGKTAEFRKQDPEYLKLWNKIDAAVKESESSSGEEAAYQTVEDMFPSERRTVETYDMPGAPSHVERIRPRQLPPRNAWFWGAIDMFNDITRLPLSGDLAFQNLQGGIIGLSNPLVGMKAFKAGLKGFAPNMQIEVGGQLYGSRKFGREVYHQAGEEMRKNPMYNLAKEAGLPLAMFEIDARLQEAKEIELNNLRATNPNATMADVKVSLMDIDELGTVDEWYSKNRITKHMPMQGQFERFNSLTHDTLLLTQFDNWVKVLLSKGYQPNTPRFNNAIKDAARILAVSVGDIKYSTKPEVDAAASRIAKIFFTAPRWMMSRALMDPLVNQFVSNSSIFARLREIMGEDNPVFHLYNGDKEVAKLGQSMILRLVAVEAMLAMMAWVFSNWYPDIEVNTDDQPGRIRVGDFQIDPIAGLFDHYKLARRIGKAVFSVDPKDASRAEKEGIPQWMLAYRDIGKELSYKASPGVTFLQAITGLNDLRAQVENPLTFPMEAKALNVVGEPLFERSASAKIFYEMIRPRLREVFGDAVADDIPISNMMMDRIPMALPGFIESFASAAEYNRDPWVYAMADTIPNFFGFKIDVMPTEARKDRAKNKNRATAEDSPTLLKLLAEGRASEAFTGTTKKPQTMTEVAPW